MAQYRQAVLPIVFGALEENANNHWNPAVHGLTCNVRKMFMVSKAASGCSIQLASPALLCKVTATNSMKRLHLSVDSARHQLV